MLLVMLKCQVCDHTEEIPMHCGQPMHLEEVNNEEMLVCWMGPSCGVIEVPKHHEKPMIIAES